MCARRYFMTYGLCLRRLTDRLIPDDAVFLFIFKAWSPRIASYVRASTTQKRGKKTSSGGMRLFGNRLISILRTVFESRFVIEWRFFKKNIYKLSFNDVHLSVGTRITIAVQRCQREKERQDGRKQW